ncbi:MAG: NFACT family protein [Candidatus Altiarchaeota archaeon]|nr:NFACT family protein [Candidatus Altiarchaeota archaeon]
MKSELSSLDVSVLVDELNNLLGNSRVRNVYQIGEKELKIKFFISGKGNVDLIIAANYLCVSSYSRPSPQEPTSFAMQLRKYLKGLFLKEVRQHDFDRIVEFLFKGKEESCLLIVELFSSGNVILSGMDGKIIGVLEWQRWRHRRLGVGQDYSYPPGGVNPLKIDRENFGDILAGSDKKIASALASELNLGGLIAEEICLRSTVDKEVSASSLGVDETNRLYRGIGEVRDELDKEDVKPVLVLDSEDNPIDALPFPFQKYDNSRVKLMDSFNQAVDELFSLREIDEIESSMDKRFAEKKEKLERIRASQEGTIESMERETYEMKRVGDLIYQSMPAIEQLTEAVNEARDKNYSWDEISKKLSGREIDGLGIVEVKKDGSILLDELK